MHGGYTLTSEGTRHVVRHYGTKVFSTPHGRAFAEMRMSEMGLPTPATDDHQFACFEMYALLLTRAASQPERLF